MGRAGDDYTKKRPSQSMEGQMETGFVLPSFFFLHSLFLFLFFSFSGFRGSHWLVHVPTLLRLTLRLDEIDTPCPPRHILFIFLFGLYFCSSSPIPLQEDGVFRWLCEGVKPFLATASISLTTDDWTKKNDWRVWDMISLNKEDDVANWQQYQYWNQPDLNDVKKREGARKLGIKNPGQWLRW